MIERIGIIGGGSWGTALALVAARAGHGVTLYARDAETVADIDRHRENRRRLPGVRLDPAIGATGEIAKAFDAEGSSVARASACRRFFAKRCRKQFRRSSLARASRAMSRAACRRP
jgi:glycerol-3-phosphate dehydrogenase